MDWMEYMNNDEWEKKKWKNERCSGWMVADKTKELLSVPFMLPYVSL